VNRIPKNQSGFTLLEVLVATLIMGIAVAGLIAGLSQSVKNVSRLADYDRAVMLARTKMNDLLLDPDLPFEGNLQGEFDREQAGSIASGWRASMSPFEVPPNAAPGAMILEQVALEVWWSPPTGTRRTMQLAGYRSVRIPIPATP
jgi:type II secretion system protein I